MHISSSLLLLHNLRMMEFGSNKANKAKYGSTSMLNLVHETWDEGVDCMMDIFLCGESHYILCLSCIVDNVGHHMVVTWCFMMEGGHLTKQLKVILYVFERLL